LRVGPWAAGVDARLVADEAQMLEAGKPPRLTQDVALRRNRGLVVRWALGHVHPSTLESTSWINHRRSPVSEPVRACAVTCRRSGYSQISGDESVDAIRMRTGTSVSFLRPWAPSRPSGK